MWWKYINVYFLRFFSIRAAKHFSRHFSSIPKITRLAAAATEFQYAAVNSIKRNSCFRKTQTPLACLGKTTFYLCPDRHQHNLTRPLVYVLHIFCPKNRKYSAPVYSERSALGVQKNPLNFRILYRILSDEVRLMNDCYNYLSRRNGLSMNGAMLP